MSFLTVGGFQYRDFCETRVVAIVLFVLGAVHPGIVGRDHHEAALDADVGCGHQGIGGHVQSHVLHGHQCAATGEGSSYAHLQGYLLVHRPLYAGIRVVGPGQSFEYLGARRAGIAGGQMHAGGVCAQRDGLVAR